MITAKPGVTLPAYGATERFFFLTLRTKSTSTFGVVKHYFKLFSRPKRSNKINGPKLPPEPVPI